jgi:5-methylcytosine-specific restriction protein A
MSRTVEEWIGKNDDAAIPPRVRVRVFNSHGGVCHLSGRRIRAGETWDVDHLVALCNGGEHRESNLAPALRDKHREKTAQDMKEKSMVYRKRAAHLGLRPARQKIASRGFQRSEPQRTASRPIERRQP